MANLYYSKKTLLYEVLGSPFFCSVDCSIWKKSCNDKADAVGLFDLHFVLQSVAQTAVQFTLL